MARLWKLVDTYEYDYETDTSFEQFRIEIFSDVSDARSFRVGLMRWGNVTVRQSFIDDPSWSASERMLMADNLLEQDEMAADSARQVLHSVVERL
ncbi:MAG: hypothetical protein WBF87_10470 [Mesorhizobium sp.]